MAAPKRIVGIAVLAFSVLAGTGGNAERSAVPGKPDDRTIVHVLNRLGFGAAPGDIDRVRRIGLQTYIDQQLSPERLPDAAMPDRLAHLETLTMSTRELASEYFVPALQARRAVQQQQAAKDPSMTPDGTQTGAAARREMMTPEQNEALRMQRQTLSDLMQAKILRAAYSERQLEEVMVDFWFNHFNVFVGKGPVRLYLNEYEREAIRPHVFGKFHDLLQATAESPAMLFYLDNWQSAAPDGAPTLDRRISDRRLDARNRGRLPRMRQPNRPATLATVPAPNRRRGLNENYARELMELHTLGVDGGYTQKDVQEIARAFTGWTIVNPRQGGSFLFEPRMHDAGEKIVLGHRIKAGGGKSDGDDVLALLAKHPSTARFIATKLARRFVADDPPNALVDRAAKRFLETDGHIREVVRTIVTSPEFFAADAYRAKVKSPFEFVVSAVRATGVDLADAMPLVLAVRNLGMPLYGCQPPTGYADKAEAWVNSGALLNRMNFAVALTSGNARGDGARLAPRRAQRSMDISSETLIASALAGELSASTAATVAKAAARPQALALVLGSPEFQRK
jgi:uncharacterized protein (DUF1800 family)